MPPTPGALFDPDDSLGATLARMRRAKNLTGRQLAELVDMSQPKISRLENGVGLPDPADVARVARALDAAEDILRHLIDLAEHAQNRMTDWRAFTVSLAGRQRSVGDLESDAKTLRVFQPFLIPGLLQTSEYARAVLTRFQHLISPTSPVVGSANVAEAVSLRMARQEILADQDRTFHFVMLEGVFQSHVCAPEYMPAQIQRLREVGKQDNVTISVVPAGVDPGTPPLNGFVLADESLIMIDLLNTSISSVGRADMADYRRTFDEYAQAAVTEFEALLTRHQDGYLQQMQAKR
ncbi:MAG TPA: helix-turn-helix transcriptional regulator [Asanoa sp.]|nr:helix-turn-helix transcriptional regulator [Asanoa sp.]